MTRAVCEHCDAVQPPDWRPGDLCVQCGAAVRREKRCPWCARLTPEGQFCRHCGSGLVPDELYGAARMLKAAGVDQLSLPERLRDLPPAQRDHYSRLYDVQAAVAERHIDDLTFVVSHLRRETGRPAGWVAGLENVLLPRLPLAPGELTALNLPPARETDDLRRLAEIRDGTPFALTAQLAAVAAVRQGGPRTEADAVRVAEALRSPDRTVRTEAALTLADWRYTALQPYAVQPGDLRDVLLELYRETPPDRPGWEADRAEAALGLSLLAWHFANLQSGLIPEDVLRPLLGSGHPDLAFGAAVTLGDTDRLRAALRVPGRRTVAAVALGRLGQVGAIAPVLPMLSVDDQARVLSSLSRTLVEGPDAGSRLLPLREAMLPLLQPYQTRSAATRLLLLIGQSEDALPLIEADPSLAGRVVQCMSLSVPETERLCARMLDLGQFRLSALAPLATSGQLSDAFVPAVFAGVGDDARQELLALARLQLPLRADPGLHRFLWSLVESDLPDQTRERAWSVLTGWYGAYGHELRFSTQSAQHFFGGVGPLVERLCVVIERPELLTGFFTSYDFLKLLDHVDPEVLPAVREVAAHRLNGALSQLAGREDAFVPHRAGAVRLLGRLSGSREEHLALSALLRPFLRPDAPWQLQRAALAALYPTPQARATQLAEWNLRKRQAQTYDERALLDALISQIEQLMSEDPGQEVHLPE